MTCFVINLDQRPDRLAVFREEFAREALGQTLERFPGRTSRIARNPVVNGRIGCLLSHRGVVELARDRRLERVLVFEDDVRLVKGAGQRWEQGVGQLQAEPWWMLFLGQNTLGPVLKHDENLYRVSRSVALHAVMYHRRSYDTILRKLPQNEAEALTFLSRHKAIDQFYARHLIPRVPSYCVWPHLAHQRSDVSDIQGSATRETDDDARTKDRIVGSAVAFRLRTVGWNWGQRPIYQVTERIAQRRKRKFYSAASIV